MFARRYIVFTVACLICLPCLAQDMSLAATIDAALQNDPALQTASAQQRVDAEALPKARADLLPRLSFQAYQAKNTTTSHNFAAGGVRSPEVTDRYDSSTKSVSVSQALIRPRAWMNYLQGETIVSAADVSHESAIQQSIDRVVNAYMEKLRLEVELEAARVNESALELRLTLVKRMVQAERASLVDLRAAEASYALERAKTLETSAALVAANGELSRLTGIEWKPGQGGIVDIRKVAAAVATIIEKRLQGSAEHDAEQHPEVMVRRLRLEAAQWEVKKRGSDHSPTLDLVASVADGNSASDVAIGRYAKTRAVGIQLNIPIYSGGAVNSSVREGVALVEKAEIDLKNARLILANDRRRILSLLKAGMSSLKAGVDALDASELTVRQIRMGIDAGINSEVELKGALARKAGTESTLAASVVKAVSLYSGLQLAQGVLNVDEMVELSAALK